MNKLILTTKILMILLISVSLASCRNSQPQTNSNQANTSQITTSVKTEENLTEETKETKVTLTSASANWQKNNHIHNITVHPHDPNIIYVATHHGIILKDETGKWFQVGNNKSDFMSFITDPNDHNKLYGSGHPPNGGNMGFVVSEDGGENWQEKSLPGVDFHGLAISPSDPNIFYGWIASSSDGKKGLFLSSDNGKTWQKQQGNGLSETPFNLVVDPVDYKMVFATTRLGIYQSKDQGNNWELITENSDNPIVGLLLVKEDNKVVMYGYRVADGNSGIVKSEDYGKNWDLVTSEIEGIILYLVSAPSQPEIFYAANDKNIIFQSVDSGKTWKKLS
jgi:hypothetical protein